MTPVIWFAAAAGWLMAAWAAPRLPIVAPWRARLGTAGVLMGWACLVIGWFVGLTQP